MERFIDANKIKLTSQTFKDNEGEVYIPLSDVKNAIRQTPTENVIKMDSENIEKLTVFLQRTLNEYFNITDTYAYNLTRVKEAFEVGTVNIEDFEEFSEETTRDIAEYIIEAFRVEKRCKT